jgi:FtsH-binding integral membrane protein
MGAITKPSFPVQRVFNPIINNMKMSTRTSQPVFTVDRSLPKKTIVMSNQFNPTYFRVNPITVTSRFYSTKTHTKSDKEHNTNQFDNKTNTESQLTTNNQIEVNDGKRDVGLKKFMSKVYTKMGVGVVTTLGISLALMPVGVINPLGSIGVGFITSMLCAYGMDYYKPQYKTCYVDNELIHYSENEPMREVSFWGLTTGMGITMSPFMSMMIGIDPMIVPVSVGLSAMIFGGCAYYATICKDAQMMKWKAPLAIGLGSLVTIQLIGIGSTLIVGSNALSSLIHNVDIYGGIGLFTMMSIYDSYMARKMYKNKEADHLGCATMVYLDFMNLLIRIMEAMAKAKQNH